MAEVTAETERVVLDIQKRAKLPGFRPGRVTLPLIRAQFAGEIRRKVMENLVAKGTAVDQGDTVRLTTHAVRLKKDEAGLKDGLLRLLEHEGERRSMGERGRAMVERNRGASDRSARMILQSLSSR